MSTAGVARAAPLFDALGDPNRLQIVTRLCDAGPSSTSRVGAEMPVSRQAVTKHLLALEAVGLVRSHRRGRERIWAVRTEPLGEASAYLVTVSRRWDRALDRLRDFVEEGAAGGHARHMTTLEQAVALAQDEHGLTVVATVRRDGTIQASLVNAGVMAHPATGEQVLAFVTYGKVKLANLRAHPQLAATFRNGWRYATVEGNAELAGPDDPAPWLRDAEQLRLLLREVFAAAGGTHDNWDEYDRVMAEQRRAVVLVRPTRVYGSG